MNYHAGKWLHYQPINFLFMEWENYSRFQCIQSNYWWKSLCLIFLLRLYIYIYVCVCVCVCTCVCAFKSTCLCLCACIWVRMCVLFLLFVHNIWRNRGKRKETSSNYESKYFKASKLGLENLLFSSNFPERILNDIWWSRLMCQRMNQSQWKSSNNFLFIDQISLHIPVLQIRSEISI